MSEFQFMPGTDHDLKSHPSPLQLLSALPKKDRLERPPAHALPGLVYPSALFITLVVFLGMRLLFLLRLLRINFISPRSDIFN